MKFNGFMNSDNTLIHLYNIQFEYMHSSRKQGEADDSVHVMFRQWEGGPESFM